MPPILQGTTTIIVPSLGIISGLVFPDGVRQFCGIPYAILEKRWSRSVLRTDLPNEHHDGSNHGPIAPQPPEYRDDDDPLVPVKRFPHFPSVPPENEFECLNVNIALPPERLSGPCPVMVWIHGGSLLFGSSSHPAYDLVRLTSHSVDRGTPIVCVSLNYRVGLFGFLASGSIQADLASDGYAGAGNFGLTDQQIGLQWVQRYISSFGGDPNNVTIFGESARGMSVAHQVYAAQPAVFHRAISMSGNLNCIPVWTLDEHEKHYNALLSFFGIDVSDPLALDKLRAVPQELLVSATCPIDGIVGTTGNACNDGWFHAERPSADRIRSPPEWLKSYMLGNVKDEAMIFRWTIAEDDFPTLYRSMTQYIDASVADKILALYDIKPGIPREEMLLQVEKMATDTLFQI